MPLCVEMIGTDYKGDQLVSLCHYGEQNGDAMRDPDIVYEIQSHESGDLALPTSFRNDYAGLNQEVFDYGADGKPTGVRAKLQKELIAFSATWFKNLNEQGFFGPEAKREILQA